MVLEEASQGLYYLAEVGAAGAFASHIQVAVVAAVFQDSLAEGEEAMEGVADMKMHSQGHAHNLLHQVVVGN